MSLYNWSISQPDPCHPSVNYCSLSPTPTFSWHVPFKRPHDAYPHLPPHPIPRACTCLPGIASPVVREWALGLCFSIGVGLTPRQGTSGAEPADRVLMIASRAGLLYLLVRGHWAEDLSLDTPWFLACSAHICRSCPLSWGQR